VLATANTALKFTGMTLTFLDIAEQCNIYLSTVQDAVNRPSRELSRPGLQGPLSEVAAVIKMTSTSCASNCPLSDSVAVKVYL